MTSLNPSPQDPLKTLDEQRSDVASADGVSDGHDGYEESQTQQEQEVEDDAAEEAVHVDREFEEDGGGEAELDREEEPKEAPASVVNGLPVAAQNVALQIQSQAHWPLAVQEEQGGGMMQPSLQGQSFFFEDGEDGA